MLRGMALLDTVFDDAAARGAKRHADACDELRRALLAWLIAGLLLVCGGVALGVVAAGERVPALDLVITNAVQAPRGLALDELAWAVSRLGDGFPQMVVLAIVAVVLLAVRGRTDLALFVGVAAAIRALGPVLKDLGQSPRPPESLWAAIESADGFGYPSGHALGAALFFGAIAVAAPEVTRNRVISVTAQVLGGVMIVLTAWARVRLGVHWPSDVAGGVLFGLGTVCLLWALTLLVGDRQKVSEPCLRRAARRV